MGEAEEASVCSELAEEATEEDDVQLPDEALLALMQKSAVLGPLAQQLLLQAAASPHQRRKAKKLKKKPKGARKKSILPTNGVGARKKSIQPKKRRARKKTICKHARKKQ